MNTFQQPEVMRVFQGYSGASLMVSCKERKEPMRFHQGWTDRTHVHAVDDQTVFDLASLTKPLVVSTAMTTLERDQKIDLQAPVDVRDFCKTNWTGLTLEKILRHCGGFLAWEDLSGFFQSLQGKSQENIDRCIVEKLLYDGPKHSIGKGSVYSDLGFLFLESYLRLHQGIDIKNVFFSKMNRFFSPKTWMPTPVTDISSSQIMSYESDEHVPLGVVHDGNARALGKMCAHAGLFSRISSMHEFGCLWLEACVEGNDFLGQHMAKKYIDRTSYERPLVWDCPSENSTAGNISKNSFGHLGYTGTSIWVDLDRRVVVTLLTNRVHMNTPTQIFNAFRIQIHNEIWQQLDQR
ncbi:MAG: serine hydrolase domain-containing protein [Bdellovibrionota bacterium]